MGFEEYMHKICIALIVRDILIRFLIDFREVASVSATIPQFQVIERLLGRRFLLCWRSRYGGCGACTVLLVVIKELHNLSFGLAAKVCSRH